MQVMKIQSIVVRFSIYISKLSHHCCLTNAGVSCSSNEIRCRNSTGGRSCVPKLSMCNGTRDCADGSDEDPSYCNKNCNSGEIRCLNSIGGLACVSRSLMCNGVR
ncbi:unnamed protein product [Rotaria sp. Silwood2]|nr:unnamed protein product [Rotaria sp. Silwood2]CAF3111274.1 unnamed protein product [Rotaria sp. Silwood2]CAF3240235.1 unnamed protein product [Rotaria sp. Silwood2]